MKLKISIDGRTYDVEVEDTTDLPALEHSATTLPLVQSTVLPSAALGASSDFDESKVVRSPLAGVVTRLQAAPGQRVESDEILLILEAMKMEIKITSRLAGTIKSIEVAPGNAVKPDQILIFFE